MFSLIKYWNKFFSNFTNNSKSDHSDDKKKINKIYIALCIGLIILVFSSGLFKSGKSNNSSNNKQNIYYSNVENSVNYIKDLEQRLSKILSNVEGAGIVEVMIILREGCEKVIALDSKTSEHGMDNPEELRPMNSVREYMSKPQIINNGNREEQPIVLKEIHPKVEGVIVVSGGANDKQVSRNLHKAIQASLGVMSHKIEILVRKK